MRRLLLLVMVFPLLMVSCSRGGKELAAKLHLADSLIEAEPDSGVALLVSLEEEAEDASKANRYRYQLLLAKAKNQAYVPITTDSILEEVAGYYDGHGSANQKMMAHYLLGCAYRDMGDLPQALLQYEEAIAKADTASEDCDFKTLSRVYGQAAEIYVTMFMPQNSKDASRAYVKYGLMAHDSIGIISGYDGIADAFELEGTMDSVIYYHKKAASLYRKYNMPREAAMSEGVLVNAYLNKNDLGKASASLDRYEKESGLFDGKGNIEPGMEIHYYDKGMYYLRSGAADSALLYFNKLKNAPQAGLNEKSAAAIGLAYVYHDLGELDSAYHNALARSVYSDSILRNIMKTSCSSVNASYQQQKLADKAAEKELESERAMTILAFLAFFILLIGGIFYNVIRGLRFRREQLERDKSDLERAQGELRMLLAKTEEEKERFVEQKQEQIGQLLNRIEKIEGSVDEADVERRLNETEAVKKFRLMGDSISQEPSKDDWQELAHVIERVIPTFFSKMNGGSTLRLEEYQMCILVRLHFQPYQIAHLMNITTGNVSILRKRLLKKVFGEEGGAHDFDKKVRQICR